MNGLSTLTLEGILDAVRRRMAFVLLALSLGSVLFLDSCTGVASGTITMNDEEIEVAQFAAGIAAILTFVVAGLWIQTIAGVLGADQLQETLEDGSATLALARPVSRTTFALARLLGVLALTAAAGVLVLGAAIAFLSSRYEISMAPAGLSLVAIALGSVVVASGAMCLSLSLPRMATTPLTFMAIGAIGMTNLFGSFTELSGTFGWIDRLGPPLASAIIAPLASWIPEFLDLELRVEPSTLLLRLGIWAAIGVGLLLWRMSRVELGR